MMIEENSAVASSDYQGKTYYFCAIACKEMFEEDPSRFVLELSHYGSEEGKRHRRWLHPFARKKN
jgi:YHS domain-containing protein